MLLINALLTFSFTVFVALEAAVSLSPCARWNTAGVTVFGSGTPGNATNQLNQPQGMFLHQPTNSLYVVDTENERVLRFRLDRPSTSGETVLANLGSMYAVDFDDDGATMYVARRFENRLDKWLANISSIARVGDQCKQCRDVRLDKDKNVYMTESGTHSVRRWSPTTNAAVQVAGRADEHGHTADRLYFPTGMHLHSANGALYIADTMNSRIQKWSANAKEGVTVAGSGVGVSGSDASMLAGPLYVWVDESSDIVYVVDTENDRVQRWLPNGSAGTTIAGGAGTGNGNDQLNRPTALAFDDQGNLYVCDSKNHRIQKYSVTDNGKCPSSRSPKVTTIPILLLFFSWLMTMARHFDGI